MPAARISPSDKKLFGDVAAHAAGAKDVELRRRVAGNNSMPIGARNVFSQHARAKGLSYGPEDESTASNAKDLNYPTGYHSLATYMNDGNWRIVNDAIFTLIGSIIVVFFTSMGKIWVVENVIADQVFAASLAHGLFAGFGLTLALTLVSHVVTTVDPVLAFIGSFMPHRTAEYGRNHHTGVHALSNASILGGAVALISALLGSLIAGYMATAFQFSTATIGGTPVPLVPWQRPAFAEATAALLMTLTYFVVNHEIGFLVANGNPAGVQGFVYGMLIIFTKPYSGGMVSMASHFGPSIASESIVSTTANDWSHLYLPNAIGTLVGCAYYFWTHRFSRQPKLATAPYRVLDEEAGTAHAAKHETSTSSSD